MRAGKAQGRDRSGQCAAIWARAELCDGEEIVMVVGATGSGSASSATAGDRPEPAEEPANEAPETAAAPRSAAAARWRRLVRAIQRGRRLERLWGVLGGSSSRQQRIEFLEAQGFQPELRDRLRDVHPLAPRRR